MAAPANAYFNPILGTYLLNETEHQRAIPNVDEATLKSRFFLDYLVISVDVNINEGFTGMCDVGSYNYNMHSNLRLGSFGSKADTRAFWDAGLNTKGEAFLNSYSSSIGFGLVVSLQIKTAYYVPTTEWGFRFRLYGSGAAWGYASAIEYVGENTVKIGSTTTNQYNVGDVVEIQPYNVNAEGTFFQIPDLITISRPSIEMVGAALYGSWAVEPAYSRGTYYSDSFQLDSYMYTGANSPTLAPQGYYQIPSLQSWVYVDSTGLITKGGGIGTWDDGDPAQYQRYTPIPFVGSAPISGNKSWEFYCENTNLLQPFTAYLDNNTGKYVASNNNNGYDWLTASYYYVSNTQFMEIINGDKISDGYCDGGVVIEN